MNRYIASCVFRLSTGELNTYEPIAVIEFMGNITSDGISYGHYICDILEAETRRWYRTNDNAIAKLIKKTEISKQGYVVLYKLKTDNSVNFASQV